MEMITIRGIVVRYTENLYTQIYTPVRPGAGGVPLSVPRWLRTLMATVLMLGLLAAPALANSLIPAVERLQRFAILPDDELGELRAGQFVTRAEFATFIALAAGLEPEATELTDPPPFTDLQGHLAAGYVAAVHKQGYMNGYPNGTFRPEGAITYAEALAVLVRLAGLEPDPQKGWPDNYADVAAARGIIPRGMVLGPYIKAPAVRGAIFVLLDRAMIEVPNEQGQNLYQRFHDSDPPVVILDPVEPTTSERRIQITGTVRGASEVRVSGHLTTPDADGRFSAYVNLALGLNGLSVQAEDEVGNRTMIIFAVTRVAGEGEDEENPAQ